MCDEREEGTGEEERQMNHHNVTLGSVCACTSTPSCHVAAMCVW